jgi:hypothetical protein
VTAELKRLDLPATVVYVPADEYCYQALAYLVSDAARGLYRVTATSSGDGIEMRFSTSFLRSGQSIIFGLGDAVENGFPVDAVSAFVVTGRLTACQYHSVPDSAFPTPVGPTSMRPSAGPAIIEAGVGDISFSNTPAYSGK